MHEYAFVLVVYMYGYVPMSMGDLSIQKGVL